jgi:hypothetical protein
VTAGGAPGDFPVALTYDDEISPLFWTIDADRRTTYSTAGYFKGATVFGRGVRLGVRVTNHSEQVVTLRALRVRTLWSRLYPSGLRYKRLVTQVPAPPLPFASGQANVRLTEDLTPQGVVAVRGVRGELGPAGGPAASRVVEVVIEAAVSGLWACGIEAESGSAGQTRVTAAPLNCLVLLRGK